jgi:Co/Zn/Cd efflux system component
MRILNPIKIEGEIMLIVSGICLVFNLLQMSILHSKDMHDFAHAPGANCGHDHIHDHEGNEAEHVHVDGKQCKHDHSK